MLVLRFAFGVRFPCKRYLSIAAGDGAHVKTCTVTRRSQEKAVPALDRGTWEESAEAPSNFPTHD